VRDHRRRIAALLVAVGVSAVLLTGCGTGTAGAASVVGAQRVSDAQLAGAVAEVRVQTTDGTFAPDKVTAANLTRMTRELLVGEAADREGVVVTESQIDQLIKTSGGLESVTAALLKQGDVPAAEVRSYARTFLQQQALGAKLGAGASDGGVSAVSDYLAKLSTELDTRVAARYGSWDAATQSLGEPPTDLAAPLS
jgi:hypothetical protein